MVWLLISLFLLWGGLAFLAGRVRQRNAEDLGHASSPNPLDEAETLIRNWRSGVG